MSAFEIKTVLKAIEGKEVCIRFRMKGHEWQAHHSRVLDVFDDITYVTDCATGSISCIRHNDVAAFELDRPVLNYEARRSYKLEN